MAKKAGVNIQKTIYAAFKGADFSTDPSLVDRSRSPVCTNIVADGGGMPQKRLGWRVLYTTEGTVYGLFSATFNGTVHKLAHPVAYAPQKEIDRRSVPQAAYDHDEHYVGVCSDVTFAVTSERDINVISEKRSQRNMPSAPELRRG